MLQLWPMSFWKIFNQQYGALIFRALQIPAHSLSDSEAILIYK